MSDPMMGIINILFLFALIALIYFIGRSFSRLAEKHKKEKWKFAILGIGVFFLGISIGSYFENFFEKHFISGVLRLPLGILATLIVFILLKNKLNKNT
jgi:uncharacterized membrane protein